MTKAQQAASLKAFNKWFAANDLPGSASEAAYEGWEAGEKRAISNANRTRAKLEKLVDDLTDARDRARASLRAANQKLRARKPKAPAKDGLRLGPGDR